MIGEVLGFAAGGYLLLLGGLALFQRDMIYQPGTERSAPGDVGLSEMVPVPLKSVDGWIVTSWYAPPKESRSPTIVLFHGNGGTLANRARKARVLLDAGYGVFLAEYRGYAGNPGRPSEEGLYADARAALLWLTTRGIPESRIVVYGESLGSGVATMIASRRSKLAAIVLEAPFTSLPEMAPAIVLPLVADLLMIDKFDNLSRISSIAAPMLIIHGERDTLVPPAMGRKLLAAAEGIKEGVFLPDAGHNDVWDQGGDNAVLNFLDRHTRK